MKKITFLFAFFLSLLGGTQAWAETADFENALPDGWEKYGSLAYHESPRCHSGSYGLGFSSSSTFATTNYLVTTKLQDNVTIWYRSYSASKDARLRIYEFKDGVIGTTALKDIETTSSTWNSVTCELSEPMQIAIVLNNMVIDDMTYTEYVAVTGPGFLVKDGSTKLTTSPYAYNFGLATAGTTKEFTLSNPGTAATPIKLSTTGNVGASIGGATSIAAGGEVTLTLTMPNVNASGTVTITPTGDGLSPFVFNVSGVLRDPNKVYLTFSDGSMPDGWTSVQTGSSSTYPWTATTGYVYTRGTSNGYQHALTSPKLVFAKDEVVMFKTARYNDKNYYGNAYVPSIVVEYSTNGSSWTAIGSAFTDDAYGSWTQRSVTIPVDGVQYIRFNGYNMCITEIYGGELPLEPKMVVTQPASLDFGLLNKDATPATKTFTIANTGRATLNGISVTSANAAFTVTGAPSSLAAGASQEVTITMATGTIGALSSDIKVSATGMDEVTFTVSGCVMAADAFVIDFNDNALPSGWGNNATNKWNFGDGKAYCTSAAELTSPKLQFTDGDFFVVNITSYDDYDNNYLEIYTSTDGTSWEGTPVKRYISRSQIPYGSYTNLVVTDIPTSVKYLKFKGSYVRIDDITGLTYAPVLSVTKDAAAVTTPAAYDFRECGTNATVTYNFANAGAGTINITNVAITGDGAAAYSTNWTTSVAAPFDLVITRAYDAERGGAAQNAVVTVTTSEGDFVINVTGTDLAADAPAMGVTLGGAAVANGDAADFGTKLKAAPAAKTYTITNIGTGTLTGTIATRDETQFTVSKTSFSLAASESTTFDVSLVFNTTYGDKAATITIHPTVDGLEDVVINATATTMDPETWEEDFEGGSLPTGWTQGTWTIGTNNDYENKTTMALAPSSGTAGTIVTPCLTAKAGDVLTWDGYFNWYDEAMTVEYSNDNQETWTKIYDAYKAQSEFGDTRYTHKEMSFTAPADGDYYLRFTSTWRNGVDNFCGFKLNLPDHIMAITASNISSSTSYTPTMKIGKSFEATVTVTELRGVAENFTAKLYMGSEVIGTVNGSVEAGATKEVTIVATPTSSGSMMMHFEVEYAGGVLTTSNLSRYVADLNLLTLDETSASESLATGTYDVVTLKRTFVAGWNTVCLPNAVTDIEAFFGTGAKAYNFNSYEGGVLGFAETTSMEASYPYIIYVPAAITDDFILNDFEITYSNRTPGSRYKGTSPNFVYFYGTYAPIAAPNMDGKWGVTDEAKIAKGNASASINGFRGYFTLPDGASARLAFTDEDGTTTVINALELNQNVEGVYNLQGQKVERMQKGLYIVNGRKVVKK